MTALSKSVFCAGRTRFFLVFDSFVFPLTFAYFYDINFKATYESIRDNHYVDKIIGRIPYTNPDTGKQMEQIRNEMNLYIQNAINENGNYR